MSALTSIVTNKNYELPQGRKPAFDRVNMRVGNGQSIVGHPFLRNASMKPIDVLYQEARMSDTPRIGESSSLPDRRINDQTGSGIFGSIKRGLKKIKKKKILSKTADVVGSASALAAPIALATGRPELAALAGTTSAIAKPTAGFLKSIGLGRDKTLRKLQKQQEKKELVKTKKAKKVQEAKAEFEKQEAQLARKLAKQDRKIGKLERKAQRGGAGQKIGRSGNPLVMRGSGYAEDIAIARGRARGIGGSEKLTFVATHPMNFKPAKLN